MAGSRVPPGRDADEEWQCHAMPARTPGPLGMNDQGDPSVWSFLGDTPGPLGKSDHASPTLDQLLENLTFSQRLIFFPPSSETASKQDVDLVKAQENPDVVLLAAVAYGEASGKDLFEEMAGIATVIVREQQARGKTLQAFIGSHGTYAFAASDKNPRTASLRKTAPAERVKMAGMAAALKAAQNALSGGADFSKGAFFWDGADIKSNYDNHPKVQRGIRFTKKEHNIYNIAEKSVDVTTHWQTYDKEGKLVAGAVRGKYTAAYESTAAYGGTIFWKYTQEFLAATGNKEYE